MYRYIREGYRRQLSRPFTQRPLPNIGITNSPLDTADRIHPTPLLPAITGGPPPRILGRKEPNRHEDLEVAVVDTRPGRDEAIACTTSAGDTPQAPTTMDTSSPPTTDAAGRYANQVHSPNFHTTQNCFFILEPKGQKTLSIWIDAPPADDSCIGHSANGLG